MIYFFSKQYAFFVTVFFVFCANNAMESLISFPSTFCGKRIKKNSAYEKKFVNDHAGNLLSRDTRVKIGQDILGADWAMPCEDILYSWTHTCSLNQYFNFVPLVFKVAKKVKVDVYDVLHFIHEQYENDFFEGLEAIKIYKKLSEKIKINDEFNTLTADEYAFLIKNVLTGQCALVANSNMVYVQRTLIERFYVEKKQELMNLMQIPLIIDGIALTGAYCTNLFTLQTCGAGFFLLQSLKIINTFFFLAAYNTNPIVKTLNNPIVIYSVDF